MSDDVEMGNVLLQINKTLLCVVGETWSGQSITQSLLILLSHVRSIHCEQ